MTCSSPVQNLILSIRPRAPQTWLLKSSSSLSPWSFLSLFSLLSQWHPKPHRQSLWKLSHSSGISFSYQVWLWDNLLSIFKFCCPVSAAVSEHILPPALSYDRGLPPSDLAPPPLSAMQDANAMLCYLEPGGLQSGAVLNEWGDYKCVLQLMTLLNNRTIWFVRLNPAPGPYCLSLLQ